jgi:peptide deformylase
MKLPIYSYGSPILRKQSVEIEKDYPNLENFINDMFETMDSANGIGLSAPQVGKNIRVIVIDSKQMHEDYPEDELDKFREVFINPIIEEEFGDDFTFREGCLSLPRLSDMVTRPSKIIITYFDKDWKLHEKEFSGIKARILQHEYDHLEGKLWIDKLSPIKRKLIQSKLNKISKGDVYHEYPMKFTK